MARAPYITDEYLKKLILGGAGMGYGEDYRPFLEIRRWNPSPVSTQVVGGSAVPPFRRQGHFFSLSEWRLSLLYAWAGCWVREQFPLWPWPHPHPLAGWGNAPSDLPQSEGLWALCRESGIDHGYFPGTRIPYFWTIDLSLILPWIEDPAQACCFVSVKPLQAERYLYVDPLDRSAEKLEMERRYAKSMGIHYFLGDRSLYPGTLLDNLDWLHKAAVIPAGHPRKAILDAYLDQHGHAMNVEPPLEWRARLQKDFGAAVDVADFLVHHCLWNQYVDADISIPLDLSQPVRSGGQALCAAVRASLQGAHP
jgi:hypothetical protein